MIMSLGKEITGKLLEGIFGL